MTKTKMDLKIIRVLVLMLLDQTFDLQQFTNNEIGEALGMQGNYNYLQVMASRYMAQLPELKEAVEKLYLEAQAKLNAGKEEVINDELHS